jgi:hypothetical protein
LKGGFALGFGMMDGQIKKDKCWILGNVIKLFSLFLHFLSPSARNGGWTQTLDLDMMRQVFYHRCLTI